MRFALLGSDSTTIQFAEWLAEADEHEVAAIYQAGDFQAQLHSLHPNATAGQEWESLLLQSGFDAVVVSSQPTGNLEVEQRADQLRKLVQQAVPTILIHPVCESIVAFELEMIRTDTKCPLVAYVPNTHHSAFQTYCEQLRNTDASIGTVEQIVVERAAHQRDRESVLKHLAVDTLLITDLMGNAKSVSASGVPDNEEAALSNLSVAFVGSSRATARWSIGPAVDDAGVTVTAVGEKGKASLFLAADLNSASLTVNANRIDLPDWKHSDSIEDVVHRLSQLIDGQDIDTDLAKSFHALEAVDAVLQSCRRRRTIELLVDQPTEEDTFKAMMAAGGCGMLLWTLILVILGPLLFLTGSAFLKAVWYVLLLGPMGVFLMLQLLRFVFDSKPQAK
ncbi:MAG: hypothetical protein KDB27_24750 [Planctomycetales bacterium]|nr:hypothetical protein [Planctomycetales bacterium]